MAESEFQSPALRQSAEEQNGSFIVFSVAAVAREMDKCDGKTPEDNMLDFVVMLVCQSIFSDMRSGLSSFWIWFISMHCDSSSL